jgi:hypothetical protein
MTRLSVQILLLASTVASHDTYGPIPNTPWNVFVQKTSADDATCNDACVLEGGQCRLNSFTNTVTTEDAMKDLIERTNAAFGTQLSCASGYLAISLEGGGPKHTFPPTYLCSYDPTETQTQNCTKDYGLAAPSDNGKEGMWCACLLSDPPAPPPVSSTNLSLLVGLPVALGVAAILFTIYTHIRGDGNNGETGAKAPRGA